jgi:hypothetical protein
MEGLSYDKAAIAFLKALHVIEQGICKLTESINQIAVQHNYLLNKFTTLWRIGFIVQLDNTYWF